MTRLTDEQIDNVVHDVRQALGGKAWYRHFADRIAALAVQEVERERELAVNAHNHAHRRCAELELAHDRLRAEVATLTAQLAEVTKERDRARAERADLTSRNTALRAQLATAKREGAREALGRLQEWWADTPLRTVTNFTVAQNIAAFRAREYPATPSGEGVTQAEPCLKHNPPRLYCYKCRVWMESQNETSPATAQPEAIVIPVDYNAHDGTTHITITAPLARRLLALAQTGEGV